MRISLIKTDIMITVIELFVTLSVCSYKMQKLYK